MSKTISKKFKFAFAILLVEAVLFFARPELSTQAWSHSFHFMGDIMGILPPVLLLLALLEAWLPSGAIESNLGKGAGVKGMLIATLMGSMAAGPLFAAFPIAASLSRKGGSTANTVIFLGSWATIKIPMLMMESRFLGVKFSLLRLVITIPFILLMGALMEKWSPLDHSDIMAEQIADTSPNTNVPQATSGNTKASG